MKKTIPYKVGTHCFRKKARAKAYKRTHKTKKGIHKVKKC